MDTETMIRELESVEEKHNDDAEWCDQSVGYCGDDFRGDYYWPMDNGKYMCMYFEC